MTTDALIATHGLALGYGGDAVVEGVSLAVRPGEFWCLIGSNGCGKSTLLRGLLGLLAPTSGTIEIAAQLGRGAHVGYVPQRSELSDALPTTVRELVSLGLVRSHVPRGRGRDDSGLEQRRGRGQDDRRLELEKRRDRGRRGAHHLEDEDHRDRDRGRGADDSK